MIASKKLSENVCLPHLDDDELTEIKQNLTKVPKLHRRHRLPVETGAKEKSNCEIGPISDGHDT